jgi:hypothetical protein
VKYYVRIDNSGACFQAPTVEELGVGDVYEVCPCTYVKFFRLEKVEYKDGCICSNGEVVCSAIPYQKILDKSALLEYIREERVLTTASGLTPWLFKEELSEIREKIAVLASGLASDYPEKKSFLLSVVDSVGINDVTITPSGE